MNTPGTEQSNKLIAEFMGYDSRRKFFTPWNEDTAPKYHTSWDWLMPVVEKIESMGYTFKICRRRVEIDKDGEHEPFPLILAKEETKQASAYSAVIQFITWYNNQKSPQ
jgi:hypothetical protein